MWWPVLKINLFILPHFRILRTRSSLNICVLGSKSLNTMLYRGMPKKRHTLMFNVILKEMKSLSSCIRQQFVWNICKCISSTWHKGRHSEDRFGGTTTLHKLWQICHSLGCHSHSYCKVYLHLISTNTQFWSDFIGTTYVLWETFVMV